MPLLSFISRRKQSRRSTPPEVQKTSSRLSTNVGSPKLSLGSQTRSLESLPVESLGFSPASSTASFVSTTSDGCLDELPASSNASFLSTASEDYNINGMNSSANNGMRVSVLPPPPPPQKDLDSNIPSLGQEWMKIDDSSEDESSDSDSSDDESNDGGSFMSAHHEPFLQNLAYGHGAAESINPSKKAKASSESILLVEEPDNVILQLKQQLNAVHIALSEAQTQCTTLEYRVQTQEERIKSQEAQLASTTRSWKNDRRYLAVEKESKEKEMREVKEQLEVALLDLNAKAQMIDDVRKVLSGRELEIRVKQDELKEARYELAQSKDVCELYAKEKSTLTEDNTVLRAQLVYTQATLQERDACIISKRKDEEARTRLVTVLEKDEAELRLQLESVQAIIEERNTTLERMNKDVAGKSKIIAGLEEDNASLRLRLESTHARAEEADAIIAGMRKEEVERTNRIAGLEEDKVALSILLQSTQARVEERDATVICFRKEEAEITKYIAKLEDDNAALHLQLESTDATITRMKEEEAERAMRITQLEASHRFQAKSLDIIIEERDTSARRLSQMEDEKKERISEAEKEKESFRIRFEGLQADVVERDATIERIRKSKDHNAQNLALYQRAYRDLVQDKQKLLDEKNRMQSELEELRRAKELADAAEVKKAARRALLSASSSSSTSTMGGLRYAIQ